MLTKRKIDTFTFCLLFLLPALVFYCVFIIAPIFVSFNYSLTRWNGISAKRYIGFGNYITSFTHPHSLLILKNTGLLTLISVLEQIPFGLVFAYMLFRNVKGYRFFRVAYYLPVIIAPVAIGTMFRVFFNGEIGVLTRVLELINLEELNREWLSDPDIVMYMVIIPCVWRYNGFYVVIFIARMMAIPEELFESALMDGANSRQIFLKIIVPQVAYMILICSVFIVTGSLRAFDIPFTMTKGAPGYSSSILSVFMYRKAFEENRFGLGSAVAIDILVLALVLSLLLRYLHRAVGGSEE